MKTTRLRRAALTAALCLALCLALPTALNSGARAEEGVMYYDPTDSTQPQKYCTEYTALSPDTDFGTALSGDGTWYVVFGKIRRSQTFTVKGSVNLLLTDGALFYVDHIIVEKGNSLTVWAQSAGSNGSLTSGKTGSSKSAGIGGGNHGDCGTVTINGGIIKASGAKYAAGIGGGNCGKGGTVIINGGTVTAKGGSEGAGIGAGDEESGGTVIINGGIVTSTGGEWAAGIGGGGRHGADPGDSDIFGVDTGGNGGSGGSVTIKGGSVEAFGGNKAAGIGGGNHGNGGEFTVSGGSVTAKGGDSWGAGIGGGNCGSGGTAVIEGGTVKATGGENAAGIGGGDEGKGGKTTVYGGGVEAFAGDKAAGIGGGNHGSGAEFTIYGGEVKATGGATWGAGIGGGNGGNGGTVVIEGGTVKATGGENAAGIGGGDEGKGGKTTVYDGSVEAFGGDKAAGIGGGNHGSGAEFTIYGGEVKATGGATWGAGIGGGNGAGGGAVILDGGTVEAAAGTGSAQAIGAGDGASSSQAGTISIAAGMGVWSGNAAPGAAAKKDDRVTACRAVWAKVTACHSAEHGSDGLCVYCGKYVYVYLDPTDPSQPFKSCGNYKKYEGQAELTEGWYVVSGTVNVPDRVTVTGSVNLILTDGSQLDAKRGITVSESNSLTVWAQSDADSADSRTGKLSVSMPDTHSAGIGGVEGADCGSVTVNGGFIDVRGGAYAAGIGGTGSQSCGNITINGGSVTAEGGSGCAAIGGGSGGKIQIPGGTVTATGSPGAEAIGRGSVSGAPVSLSIPGMRVGILNGEEVAWVEAAARKEVCRNTEGHTVRLTLCGTEKCPHEFTDGICFCSALSGDSIAYLDPTKVDPHQECANYTALDERTPLTELTDGWYAVSGWVEIPTRITVNGSVNLILRDASELTAKDGINVWGDNSLTIYAQSDALAEGSRAGKLTATSYDTNAGIGGDKGQSGGTVIINGGTVTASSIGASYVSYMDSDTTDTNGSGAGIGGGNGGSGGRITINGGAVTAACSAVFAYGAGIGGGNGGSGGTVIINGGTVTASCSGTGYAYGAGIGGGNGGSGGAISINGGNVTALNSSNVAEGAGIGGGMDGDGGVITINGGTVMAACSANLADGAGIGGGHGGSGGVITVNDGTVTSSCSGTTYASGAGIGGGNGGSGGTVIINGGTVTSSCSGTTYASGAGIGGGYGGSAETVTVKGGTVKAFSSGIRSSSCGIGRADKLILGDVRAYESDDGGAQPVLTAKREETCGGKWVKLTECDPHKMSGGHCLYCSFSGDRAEITKATAAKKLTYNGGSQALVTAGTASGGTAVYALGAPDAAPDDIVFKEGVPTAADAGTYYVWYRAAADDDHTDGEVLGPVRVKLSPAPATITALDAWKYYGEENPDFEAKVEGAVKNEHLVYSIECESGDAVGTYKLTVIPGKNPNYTVKTADGVFTIRDGSVRLTAEQSPDGKSVSVRVTRGAAEDASARLVAAWYDGSGRLLGCAAKNAAMPESPAVPGEYTLDRPSGTEGAAVCKVFLLGAEGSGPLCPAAIAV